MSADDFSEFPPELRDTDTYPWEGPEPIVWEWGVDRGVRLLDLPSRNLMFKRDWLAQRNRDGYWDVLIDAIDTILTERGGE